MTLPDDERGDLLRYLPKPVRLILPDSSTDGEIVAFSGVIGNLFRNSNAFAPQTFTLAADSTTLTAISDVYGTNSAFPTVAGALYKFEFSVWIRKTTAGTVTFTLTNTQTYTRLNAYGFHSVATGGSSTTTIPLASNVEGLTTAGSVVMITTSLSTNTDHFAFIRAFASIGTAGNIRLRVTPSAGNVVVQAGSMYEVTRLPTTNSGFVA